MNINKIISWGTFILIIGLIVVGMIASARKSAKANGFIEIMNTASTTDWITGNASSTITLTEYSDFQCPACAFYYPIVEKTLKERGDKIRFIYRNFPLPQHQNAMSAAQAAGAAGKQGQFWEMYSMIFGTHDKWENSTTTVDTFREYAVKLGLDIQKFDADYLSDDVKQKILNDEQQGSAAGINSTPTFYLNGKKTKMPENSVDFVKLIDEAISTKI